MRHVKSSVLYGRLWHSSPTTLGNLGCQSKLQISSITCFNPILTTSYNIVQKDRLANKLHDNRIQSDDDYVMKLNTVVGCSRQTT